MLNKINFGKFKNKTLGYLIRNKMYYVEYIINNMQDNRQTLINQLNQHIELFK